MKKVFGSVLLSIVLALPTGAATCDPAGGVARTRPLCPYPEVAVYKGSGSVDDAKNFSCKVP
jgi:hypothetical protein